MLRWAPWRAWRGCTGCQTTPNNIPAQLRVLTAEPSLQQRVRARPTPTVSTCQTQVTLTPHLIVNHPTPSLPTSNSLTNCENINYQHTDQHRSHRSRSRVTTTSECISTPLKIGHCNHYRLNSSKGLPCDVDSTQKFFFSHENIRH